MSGAFVVTLDTHAPQLEWGAASGTLGGELLRQAYVVDEPAVVAATLQLPDGRRLAMSVLEDRLEVLLPYDTPQGAATISATTRDAVDNEATYSRLVGVYSPTGAPPPALSRQAAPMPTGAPGRRGHTHVKEVRSHSRLGSSSRASARARHEGVTRVRGGVAGRVTSLVSVRTSAASSSFGNVTGSPAVTRSSTRLRQTGGVTSRRPGRSIETALLLDLL